jgi:hypothetical protein
MKTFTVDFLLTETKMITKTFEAKSKVDAQDLIDEYQYSDSFVHDMDEYGKTIDIEKFTDNFEELTA